VVALGADEGLGARASMAFAGEPLERRAPMPPERDQPPLATTDRSRPVLAGAKIAAGDAARLGGVDPGVDHRRKRVLPRWDEIRLSATGAADGARAFLDRQASTAARTLDEQLQIEPGLASRREGGRTSNSHA
jgi:hypothetical protein